MVDGVAGLQAIRTLMDEVVVQVGNGRGGKRGPLHLRGDLFGMLGFASGRTEPNAQQPRSGETGAVVTLVVAGTCSHFDLLTSCRC